MQNGIISSELDKIREAQEVLKSLERRCITSAANRNSNSIYSMWLRTFYKRNVTSKKLSIETIEEQIILADAYLLTAALSFLTEDTAGYEIWRLTSINSQIGLFFRKGDWLYFLFV